MLAAEKGDKDVVLVLTKKGANLDLLNKVSVYVHMVYEKDYITEDKINFFFLKIAINFFTIIIKLSVFLVEYS